MRDRMDILGEQILNEMKNTTVGFDFGALVNAVAGIAKTAVDQNAASKAADKAKSDSADALAKSTNADAQWANAEALLFLAQKDPASKAAATVQRDVKKAEALAARSALGPEGAAKVILTAREATAAATSAADAAPKDLAKQSKKHGWQQVAALNTFSDAPAGGALTPVSSGGNWFTVKRAGMPTYAWGLVGVGSIGALILIIRAMRKKS